MCENAPLRILPASMRWGVAMKRFVEGVDGNQSPLFPEQLEDLVAEDNPTRVMEAFVEALDLRSVGFEGIDPCVMRNRPPRLSPRGSSSKSISTATSIASSQVDAWSASPSATSR